jgi:tetratricopeptide (TPR) repeat protein
LLSLLKDGKDQSIMAKVGDEFIEEASYQFREQIIMEEDLSSNPSSTIVSETGQTGYKKSLQDSLKEMSSVALGSLNWSEDFARFIYLADVNLTMPGVKGWLNEAYERYPKSNVLKFIYAQALGLDSIKAKLIIDALHTDPITIIGIQEMWTSITDKFLKKHSPDMLDKVGNIVKRIFSDNIQVSSLEAYRSLIYTVLAGYCIDANLWDKALKNIEKAISYFNDNSYAIILKGRLNAEEDQKESENMFKKALKLADQFIDNTLQNDIMARAYLGLGNIYHKRTAYDNAEKYYSKALELHPEQFLKATILLNRGCSRIYNHNVIGTRNDLSEAMEEPLLSASIHNNFGLLYFKAGLNEKAKSEFYYAMEVKADLPEAYYNLGVLYNEEGDQKRAKKLFQTALDMDGNYKEARNALKKLEGAEARGLADWVQWWFGPSTSNPKKAMGLALLVLAGIMIGLASYHAVRGETPQASLVILGITILILMLPSIGTLKIGPVELHMESKSASIPTASLNEKMHS